jgi:S-formylglutathione hydrolase FrmB
MGACRDGGVIALANEAASSMVTAGVRCVIRQLAVPLVIGILGPTVAAQPGGRMTTHEIESSALARNLLGDPAVGRFEIYTPRSYSKTTKRRYPVLYLLHGVLGTSADWTQPGYQGMTIQGVMDSLTAAGPLREMIVVVPTGKNAYGGSYYSNSPVIGNWEDFIAHELVAWVDSHYRTIPTAASRGIAGHSMGGFGTIIMAMRHADVFGAAYAMSPCCLAVIEDISAKNEVWRRIGSFTDAKSLAAAVEQNDFYPLGVIAFGAVMSPNPAKPPLLVDLPFELVGDSVRAVLAVLARWQAGVPLSQVGRSREMLVKLRAPIHIDYGFEDQFTHIPPSVRMFADSLAEYRIPHQIEAYAGDHRNQIRARMTTIVLPFFSRVLSSSP